MAQVPQEGTLGPSHQGKSHRCLLRAKGIWNEEWSRVL